MRATTFCETALGDRRLEKHGQNGRADLFLAKFNRPSYPPSLTRQTNLPAPLTKPYSLARPKLSETKSAKLYHSLEILQFFRKDEI